LPGRRPGLAIRGPGDQGTSPRGTGGSSTAGGGRALSAERGFQHEALFYGGHDEFLAGTVPFIRAGLESEEPILVAVGREKIRLIQSELGTDGEQVRFADMAELGTNPARIIPAWRDFVAEHAAEESRPRGIGEPIWPGRRPEEIVECQHHESLLNLVFDGGTGWSLLCPYDRDHLPGDVLEVARESHPTIAEAGRHAPSPAYSADSSGRPFIGPLTPAPAEADGFAFTRERIPELRHAVSDLALRAGLDETRVGDFALVISELATNTVRHGGGRGIARVWQEGGAVLCEVHDEGRLDEPLVGRDRPSPTQLGGRGLWLVNQVADLVQIRSNETGSIIRARMEIG
jgi:anti-sigma regulatory factor (Ser/Thr protein kinase)